MNDTERQCRDLLATIDAMSEPLQLSIIDTNWYRALCRIDIARIKREMHAARLELAARLITIISRGGSLIAAIEIITAMT